MAKTFPVAADVRITIPEVGADLHVRGWARNEIQIEGDLPTMRADAESGAKEVTISAGGDCELFVPEAEIRVINFRWWLVECRPQ